LFHLYPKKVKQGTLLDIETNDKGERMDLQKKLDYLRRHKYWKCNDRWEQREKDIWTWKTNGLNQVSRLCTIQSINHEPHVTHYRVSI